MQVHAACAHDPDGHTCPYIQKNLFSLRLCLPGIATAMRKLIQHAYGAQVFPPSP